jgi:hypothetical protein
MLKDKIEKKYQFKKIVKVKKKKKQWKEWISNLIGKKP